MVYLSTIREQNPPQCIKVVSAHCTTFNIHFLSYKFNMKPPSTQTLPFQMHQLLPVTTISISLHMKTPCHPNTTISKALPLSHLIFFYHKTQDTTISISLHMKTPSNPNTTISNALPFNILSYCFLSDDTRHYYFYIFTNENPLPPKHYHFKCTTIIPSYFFLSDNTRHYHFYIFT